MSCGRGYVLHSRKVDCVGILKPDELSLDAPKRDECPRRWLAGRLAKQLPNA